MLLTEEEAKNNRCIGPKNCGEEVGFGDFLALLGEYERYERRCVASYCRLAWRWAKGSEAVGGIKRVDPEDSRPLGYCGLAGAPDA